MVTRTRGWISLCAVCSLFPAVVSAGDAVDELTNAVFQPAAEEWVSPLDLAGCSELDCVPAPDACDALCADACSWDSLFTRKTLTNGLFGVQAPLAAEGISYSASLTQFYQGVTHGGQDERFRYGGKVDQFLSLDGTKMGLWKGGLVTLHAETNYGQNSNLDATGLAPVNANLLYPTLQPETSITSLTVNQFLSEEWMVSAGTFNLLDMFAQLYPQTGRGIDTFMNISSIAPLSTARPLNLSMLGASVAKLHEGQVEGTFGVFNTANATTNSSFDELFANGAVLLGYYRIFTEMGGLPGSHALMGAYSSGSYTSVDRAAWVIVPGTGVVAGEETGTWNLTYFFNQKLWVDAANAKRNVDLLTSWGISDGNPNPVSWAGNVSVQGNGMNAIRPQDAIGVSYFHTALSSDFRRLLAPVLIVDDLDGVELYYNAELTPWFHLTADVQVVEPADQSLDTALIFGLRGKIDL